MYDLLKQPGSADGRLWCKERCDKSVSGLRASRRTLRETNSIHVYALRPLRLATADPIVHAVGARPSFVMIAFKEILMSTMPAVV